MKAPIPEVLTWISVGAASTVPIDYAQLMTPPTVQVLLHDMRALKKPLHTLEHHNEEVFQVCRFRCPIAGFACQLLVSASACDPQSASSLCLEWLAMLLWLEVRQILSLHP